MKRIVKAITSIIEAARRRHPYDYYSPHMQPLPSAIVSYFPHMEKRKSFGWVPHKAMVDGRFKNVGWLNWDESHLLYNYGLRYSHKKLLEIGCWVGWSTVVFGLSKIKVTVVDPVLGGMPQGEACRDSLSRAGLLESIHLVPGCFPAAVQPLVAKGERWSMFFIDGDHEGDAPLRDARQCHKIAEADSLILLHDACQANTCEALAWLEGQGWQCGIHYTAQLIGMAWRGAMRPLTHIPDPKVHWKKIIAEHWPWVAPFRNLGSLGPEVRRDSC